MVFFLVVGFFMFAGCMAFPTPLNIICGMWGASYIVYDGLMAICDRLG